MTKEREALQFTIARWVLAKIAVDPSLYLRNNPCALCQLHDFDCTKCMLQGLGICTVLNHGAVKCLQDEDLGGFRGFAGLIVTQLKGLDDGEEAIEKGTPR